jgi:hypothetical protein
MVETRAELPYIGDQIVCLGRPQRTCNGLLQKDRKDQGIDCRDRDHAHGEATE